jgi:tetratricopeptide (TPR) repeat protein
MTTMNGNSVYGRTTIASLGAAIALTVLSAPALAASGGSSGGSSTPQCNAGWVYDKQKQVCVRKDAATDSDLYEQGRALAVAGEYEDALDLLTSVRNQNDSMVLTMIGYSKRKMGEVDEGIAYYHKALAIQPDNVLTREYLGEGYVMMGRIDLAQAELDQIGVICGVDCEQYRDLKAAIAGDPDW